MGSEVIVFISMFGIIFGIAYLFFSTRNKERLALIEKGADASIFVKGHSDKTAPIWKILVVNLALLLMGIGAGVMLGGALNSAAGISFNIAMPGSIFLMAGTGLLIGFFICKNLEKKD